MSQTDWLKEYEKEHRLAAAAKRLREFGLKIKIEGCSYVTGNDDMVFDALTKWIREAGGRRFLNMLFSQMEYMEPEGRFLTDMNGNIHNPKDVIIVKLIMEILPRICPLLRKRWNFGETLVSTKKGRVNK